MECLSASFAPFERLLLHEVMGKFVCVRVCVHASTGIV